MRWRSVRHGPAVEAGLRVGRALHLQAPVEKVWVLPDAPSAAEPRQSQGLPQIRPPHKKEIKILICAAQWKTIAKRRNLPKIISRASGTTIAAGRQGHRTLKG
jgi:hypothetical protein